MPLVAVSERARAYQQSPALPGRWRPARRSITSGISAQLRQRPKRKVSRVRERQRALWFPQFAGFFCFEPAGERTGAQRSRETPVFAGVSRPRSLTSARLSKPPVDGASVAKSAIDPAAAEDRRRSGGPPAISQTYEAQLLGEAYVLGTRWMFYACGESQAGVARADGWVLVGPDPRRVGERVSLCSRSRTKARKKRGAP